MSKVPIGPPTLASVYLPITKGDIAGVTQELVDARDLHQALKVGRAYSHWIKERIEQLALVEGKDFINDQSCRLRASVALRLTLMQRAVRGSYSPKMDDLLRDNDVLRSRLAAHVERYLQQHPDAEKVVRYHAISQLSDAEKAALMNWTVDQWQHTVSELLELGVLNVQAVQATDAA